MQHGDLARGPSSRVDVGDPVQRGAALDSPRRPESSAPPSSGWSSSRTTRAPDRAALSAAPSPAGPPPTTSTSVWTNFLSYTASSGVGSSRPSPDRVLRGEPVDAGTGGGGHHRLGAVAADLEQCVGLLDAGGDDAARAAAVDRAPTSIRPLASIAEATVSPGCPACSTSSTVNRSSRAAVDAAAGREPVGLRGAHRAPPACAGRPRGLDRCRPPARRRSRCRARR